MHTNALLIVPIDAIPMGPKPILKFDLRPKTKFHSLKRKDFTTLAAHFPATKVTIVILVRIIVVSF